MSLDSSENSTNTANQVIYQAQQSFGHLAQAFQESPYPTEKLRLQQLKALRSALKSHQDKLLKAISADFGNRSYDETLLADIWPTLKAIDFAIANLRNWMQPKRRKIAMLFQPAKANICYQPLGVVGIMSPWNYPISTLLGPLAEAIAAGNRVMLKPSELCPYTNRVVAEIIQAAFTPDEVTLIEGDAQVAAAFASLPFNHLFFTGSTQVGKKIMAAAANNLTPVTLELGGKSPMLIADDVSSAFAAKRIVYGKCLNAGQTCVAPDYVLCPEDKLDSLVQCIKAEFATLYPNLDNGDYSSIINQTHFDRLNQLIQDASEKGAQIYSLGKSDKPKQRLLGLTLITKVQTNMRVMQEEIFGPLLPIIGYTDIQQATQTILAQQRPLALYLVTHNKRLANQIIKSTHSGSVCINDSVTQAAQQDLPFGGVGHSGIGQYHGFEGFKTFSHQKSIFRRGKFSSTQLVAPPYGKLVHRLLYRWFIR
ncbi:coniferyl aldehyde dehydrogenase [Aliikangiella sp. IMCC44653]